MTLIKYYLLFGNFDTSIKLSSWWWLCKIKFLHQGIPDLKPIAFPLSNINLEPIIYNDNRITLSLIKIKTHIKFVNKGN